ncbi:glycosyltransferase [Microbacterium aurum]
MGIAGIARDAVAGYRRRTDLKRRQVPDIRVQSSRASPVVYYLVPHSAQPHGGVRVVYRHVALLNGMGIPAAVLQTGAPDHPRWFASDVPLVPISSLAFHSEDILVVPEFYGPSLSRLDPAIRTLVFNQGGYITFNLLDLDTTAPGAPYAQIPRLEGIMTVSRDSAELLALSFPSVQIDIARPVIEASRFHLPATAKKRTMAYVTTRRADELNQILHILRARGAVWEPRALRRLTETQMADALRESAVFLSLSDRDGFGLPPAEAMACGCYVVGYAGGGGTEFFDPAYCSPVASTAEAVRELERAFTMPMDELRSAGKRASAAVLSHYHEAGLIEDLERVYSRLL